MANNLDRLFRENLDQFEVTPQASSWEQVQGQIAGKKGFWVTPMKIAVAIVVLLAATIVVINLSEKEQQGDYLSAIDHPEYPDRYSFRLELPSVNLENTAAPVAATQPKVKATETSQTVTEKSDFEEITYEAISVASLKNFQLEAELPVRNQLKISGLPKQETPAVKITYIATHQPQTDSLKVNKFNTLIAYFSNDVSPTEILADIREVKDNLFSKN